MPGHFTHIYTARRVADNLRTGQFPDWPQAAALLKGRDPKSLGDIMFNWEKFTALGAIGPDLFYFCQDWNSNETLAVNSDRIMLALSTYYFIDSASEDDWEPLLAILAEADSQLASFLRFLIKLQKIWADFVKGWNATVGPIVKDIDNLIDGLTGGILSQAGVLLDELKLALKTLAEEELTTFIDIFSKFDTCVQKGFGEQLFLWSDMSHYRRPSALCQAFVAQSDAGRAGHAHAGVWTILSLLLQVLLDSTRLSTSLRWLARVAAPVSAVALSAGFFGLAFSVSFRWLIFVGVFAMFAALVITGVGLLRNVRDRST